MVLQNTGIIRFSELRNEYGQPAAGSMILLGKYYAGGAEYGVKPAGAPNVTATASNLIKIGQFYGAFKVLAPRISASIPTWTAMSTSSSVSLDLRTSYQLTDSRYVGPLTWSLTSAPAGVSIGSSTGVLTVAQNTNATGYNQSFSVVGQGGSASGYVPMNVTAYTTPVVVSGSSGTVTVTWGSTQYFYFSQTASGTGTITWGVVSPGAGGSMSPSTGNTTNFVLNTRNLSAGTYDVQVYATNQGGVSENSTKFTLTINYTKPSLAIPAPYVPAGSRGTVTVNETTGTAGNVKWSLAAATPAGFSISAEPSTSATIDCPTRPAGAVGIYVRAVGGAPTEYTADVSFQIAYVSQPTSGWTSYGPTVYADYQVMGLMPYGGTPLAYTSVMSASLSPGFPCTLQQYNAASAQGGTFTINPAKSVTPGSYAGGLTITNGNLSGSGTCYITVGTPACPNIMGQYKATDTTTGGSFGSASISVLNPATGSGTATTPVSGYQNGTLTANGNTVTVVFSAETITGVWDGTKIVWNNNATWTRSYQTW